VFAHRARWGSERAYNAGRSTQIDYRRDVLGAGWVDHEHLLDDEAKNAGRKFVIPEAAGDHGPQSRSPPTGSRQALPAQSLSQPQT